jgi:hypothetical protein
VHCDLYTPAPCAPCCLLALSASSPFDFETCAAPGAGPGSRKWPQRPQSGERRATPVGIGNSGIVAAAGQISIQSQKSKFAQPRPLLIPTRLPFSVSTFYVLPLWTSLALLLSLPPSSLPPPSLSLSLCVSLLAAHTPGGEEERVRDLALPGKTLSFAFFAAGMDEDDVDDEP